MDMGGNYYVVFWGFGFGLVVVLFMIFFSLGVGSFFSF